MTVILMKITLNIINLNLNLLTLWFLSLLVVSKISFKEIIWSSTVQYFILFSIPFNLFHISDYQGGNQNPYIEDNRQHNGQTKKYKRTNNDLQNIHIKLTQVLRKSKQFIIHQWNPSCVSSYKPVSPYDKWNMFVVICDRDIP